MLIAITEILTFRVIDNFVLWLAGIGLIGIVGGLIRLTNLRLQVPEDFESPAVGKLSLAEEKQIGPLYLILGCGVSGGSIVWRFSPFYNAFGEWTILVGLFVLICLVLWIDSRDLIYVASFANNQDYESDLVITKQGGLRYKSVQTKTDKKSKSQEKAQDG